MRLLSRIVFIGCVRFALALSAVTLKQLQDDPHLTPKRFAKYFDEFRYESHPEVQPFEVFLGSQSGDCDDYAILADHVLRPKGYATRLIFVRMPGLIAHVVCYVGEEKGYLDYNNRAYWIKIERSGPDLRDIAAKVARSFSANWTSVSEFTFEENGLKRFIKTIAKTDIATRDNQKALSNPGIKIDF